MLTLDEIELLMEGIDEWIKKPDNDILLKGVIAISMGRSEQEGKERLDKLFVEEDKKKIETKLRQERAILLKAKLIMLRDKIIIEEETA